MSLPPLLLVEDNRQDEMMIIRAFKKVALANDIVVCRDGQQALDYLFQPDDGTPLPAVVVLDIGLPRLSGLDVLAKIRETPATALLPVVLLTSSDEEQDKLQGYRSGANSFVRKPVAFGDFAETVASLGLYWTAINKTPSGTK